MDSAAFCFNPECVSLHQSPLQNRCEACGDSLRLQNRYRGLHLLGQSNLSRTFLAVDDTTNHYRVIKQYACDRHWKTQIKLLKELGAHSQVPTLLDYFEQDQYCYLVQEYVDGQTLSTTLKKISEVETWEILESVLRILQFIHAYNVIHRDIQPQNLIQRNAEIVLVDFDSACFIDDLSSSNQIAGSAEYAAPEQLKGHPVFASDLYSLGITSLQLLTGIEPFYLFDAIARSNYLPKLDDRLAQFLDRLTAPILIDRFDSAKAALRELLRLRGKKQSEPIIPRRKLWNYTTAIHGHQGVFAKINAVAISPDNQQIASASDDKTVRLWDVEGNAISVLQGHTNFVQTVAFHPHRAGLLVSAGRDRTIKFWQNNQNSRTISAHTGAIHAVAFSPNGALIASGSADKTVKLWEVETGTLIATLSGHTLSVNALAISPNGAWMASASADATIRIWNLLTFELMATLSGHTGTVRAIAISADNQRVATGGEDKSIRIWNCCSWQCVSVLSGHPWSVSGLAFTPAELISSSWDQTLKVWQTDTGKEIDKLVGHTDSITSLAVSSDQTFLVTGSRDQTIRIAQRKVRTGG